MMIALLLSTLFLGAPPMPAVGTPIAVPEHFYRRIESVDDMPASYGTQDWGEGHFGSWMEASRTYDPEAIPTIIRRLGPPLVLPPWSADGDGEREAYVYAMRTSAEAGLILLVDRSRPRIVMRIYRSWLQPMHIKARPPSMEWEAMLMTWFRWLTTPDEKLPGNIRAAGRTHPFTMTVNGKQWIMPGMHLPMIAGAVMGRSDVPRPGGKIVVPDQFYTPITDVADLPAGWTEPSWAEKPYPAPVEPRAEGSRAMAAALENLGPPLALPPTGSGDPAREGWVFGLKAHPEGGLIAVLDRQAPAVELRVFYSDRLPAHVPSTPTGHWWHALLAKWWRAQVDPGFEMPRGARFVDRPAP